MAFAFLERNWAAAPTPASRLPVRCSVARGTAAGTPASDAPEHLRQFSIPLQSPQRRRLSSAVAASVLQSPAAQTQNETGRILLLDYSSAVDPAGPSSGELTEAYSPSASHSALPQTSTTSQSARARRAASDVDVAADSAESDIELEEQRHQASPFPSPAPSPSSHSSSSSFTDSDLHFMRLALQQARRAAAADEVPVGAVLVAADGATVLAAGHNRVHRLRSPLAHAEMLCLAAGAARSRAWRLLGTTLYVTLEPCPMCAGALMQARVGRVVYGARQPRLGADGSWVQLFPQAAPAAVAGRQAGQQQQQQQQQQQRVGQAAAMQQAGHRCGAADVEHGLSAGQGLGNGMAPEAEPGMVAGRAAGQGPEPEAWGRESWLSSRAAAASLHTRHTRPHRRCADSHTPASRDVEAAVNTGADAGPKAAPSVASAGACERASAAGAPAWAAAASASVLPEAPPPPPHPFHDSIVVEGGCLAEECADVMRAFFRRRRREAA